MTHPGVGPSRRCHGIFLGNHAFALMVAFVSTALNVIWNAPAQSWRSPHDMERAWTLAKPRTVLLWSFAAATVSSFLGRRKSPSLDASWSVSMGWYFN